MPARALAGESGRAEIYCAADSRVRRMPAGISGAKTATSPWNSTAETSFVVSDSTSTVAVKRASESVTFPS